MLSSYDRERLVSGSKLRLKELGNVEIVEGLGEGDDSGHAGGPESPGRPKGPGSPEGPGYPLVTARYIGDDRGILKEGAVIVHWIPVDGAVAGKIRMPDGKVSQGLFEPLVAKALGEEPGVVQLERFGFANLTFRDGIVSGAYLHY